MVIPCSMLRVYKIRNIAGVIHFYDILPKRNDFTFAHWTSRLRGEEKKEQNWQTTGVLCLFPNFANCELWMIHELIPYFKDAILLHDCQDKMAKKWTKNQPLWHTLNRHLNMRKFRELDCSQFRIANSLLSHQVIQLPLHNVFLREMAKALAV